LKKYQEKRSLIIHAFCIMPSHIHLIISSKDSSESLGGVMRGFKKLSNKKITEEIKNINESRKEWLLRAFQKAGNKLKKINQIRCGRMEIDLLNWIIILYCNRN
jgi:REP element-mobilizing transposase RayT